MNLLNQTELGDLSNYVTNGEWDLVRLTVERNVVYYSCCEAPYPDITYRIVLLRRPLFYGKRPPPPLCITALILVSTAHNLKKASSSRINIADHTLIPSPSVKMLDVILDQSLTWEEHISSVVKSVTPRLSVCIKFIT